jgi:ABC-2 type transport system permease protein
MSRLPKALLPVKVFSKIAIRRTFRDKTALFFTFAFPLIFLFVFGGIFGKSSGGTSFKVAVINESKSPYAGQIVDQINGNKLYKVSQGTDTLDAAKDKMNRGQLDAAIVLPANFGDQTGDTPSGKAVVYYTQNNLQASQALTSILQAQFQGINQKFVSTATPFTVTSTQLSIKGLTAFDYTFAGLLGFSIIGLGIFGPVNVFPELKKQGVLRRLHTTPLKVWHFMANVVSQTVVGLMTMALLFAVAITVFKLNVVGNWFAVVFFLTISITMILGIGLALGGWAKNERQAAPLSNIVVFPMLFLSGTFFPRFLMPQWLQTASNFLPLTPVIDGIRLITTEGKSLLQLGPQIGLIAIWTVVIYFIAFRVFRWE